MNCYLFHKAWIQSVLSFEIVNLLFYRYVYILYMLCMCIEDKEKYNHLLLKTNFCFLNKEFYTILFLTITKQLKQR